jgi:gamma-butyrobetaine dioxygenase
LLRVTGLAAGCAYDDGGVRALCRALGIIMSTNFGEVFDVRATAAPNNAAFAEGPLLPHTDNPYRTPVPGFQALACRTAAAAGGATTFADGFALAAALDAAAKSALRDTPVAWGWATPACAQRAVRPVLECDQEGRLQACTWNDRALRCPAEPAAADAWFAAAVAWQALLHSRAHAVEVLLQPGDGVVWDNRRLLHGRTAYSDAAGSPPRWLVGAYISEDSILGAWAAERGTGAW